MVKNGCEGVLLLIPILNFSPGIPIASGSPFVFFSIRLYHLHFSFEVLGYVSYYLHYAATSHLLFPRTLC